MRVRKDFMEELDEELKEQERRMSILITMNSGANGEYKPDLEKLRQQSDQFYYKGYDQPGQETPPPAPTVPPETPDEFNPHSQNFYQNTPGSDGSYVNDAFSKGYTYENGNDSGHFESTPDFQGFQGYYDNSGFENYEGYTGPDPYYRGYHGNAGTNPGVMTSGVPVSSGENYKFTPDYEQLRRQSGKFYYQGYNGQSQAAAPAPPGKAVKAAAPESSDMPYYRFSSTSHIWSAGSLLITFLTSLLACKFPDIFVYPFMIKDLSYFSFFIPFLIFLVSGGVVYWLINKFNKTSAPVFLFAYAAFTGFTTAPILLLFGPENAEVMSYSYLACTAVLFTLSVIGQNMKKNLNNIGFIFLGGGVAVILEFVICHYAMAGENARAYLMTMTIVLIAYNAFETTAVKRIYDEDISNEDGMSRNAVLAAIGHYASVAVMLLRLLGIVAVSSLDAKTRGEYSNKWM